MGHNDHANYIKKGEQKDVPRKLRPLKIAPEARLLGVPE